MMHQKLDVQQTDFKDSLLQLSKLSRFSLITIAAALAAYYIPFIVASLFGKMLNMLWMWIEMAFSVSFLIITTIISNKLKKVWMISLCLSSLLTAYQISLGIRMIMPGQSFDFFWKASLPVISILLNAALFQWGKKYAELEK
ncbi:hypothetical protein [Armatimonas rosea]|uniref:Cellulose synthase/poly-beta-1,6-N-acetylglucosamine synthase-like glycosyltransferase n=1 Tax=Armatimonas rosea TaxID=685828 RepID=A0A7W9SLY4_ARMRO|nr:hypothetical protein [Armatimonas rosea]MBB6048283.1 cellulose synthase/poly-beta-1,6-N-acetylglucosamine synthase-like glycosyltransferase [Armatimonas rosea]